MFLIKGRKVFAILLSALLLITTFPFSLNAEEGIEYISWWEGENKGITETEYYIFPDSTYSLSDATYVVDRDITLNDRLVINGTVKIILGDGFTLTCNQGITVTGSNTLYVYGQSNQTGKLIANASDRDDAAGIGGDASQSGGTIHFCGGIVEASGGEYGAGIGGGDNGDTGNINIHGGKITATGGYKAAGIGGGRNGYGGTINTWYSRSENTITTTGGEFGAGIGSGDEPGDRGVMTINIKGGIIEATGGDEAAGIGGGNEGNGANITIEGNINHTKVTAKGGRDSVGEGAGIGGGDEGDGGIVTINGGDVFAEGGFRAAGIGGGADGSNTRVYINDGKVRAYGGGVANVGTRQSGGAGIGGGAYGYGGVIFINGGEIDTRGFWGAAGIGGGYGAGATNIAISGGKVSATGESGGAGIGGGHSGDVGNLSVSGGEIKATAESTSTSEYGAGAAIGSGNGGYIANLTISGGTIIAMCDTANNGAAGIGGGNEGYFGNIRIEGGKIENAKGLGGGAGIGSGSESKKRDDQPVAKITISDGTINAKSIVSYSYSSTGAGIGSGNHAISPVHIEITGGNIEAYCGLDPLYSDKVDYSAAAIGSGYASPMGTITITGGTIKATRGKGCTKADPIGYYNDVQNSVYPNIIFNYNEAQIRNEKGEGTDKRVNNNQYDEDANLSRRLALLENDSDWVEIKPCDHVEATYEMITPGENGTHKIIDEYCLDSDTSEHTHVFDSNNQCVCGYYRYLLTFTDNQPNGNTKEVYVYPDISTQGTVLPEPLIKLNNYAPTYVIPKKEFKGWKVENDSTGRTYFNTDDYVVTKDSKFIAQWSDIVGISVVLSSIDGPLDQIGVGDEIIATTSINDLYQIALDNDMQTTADKYNEYILSSVCGNKPMDEVASMTEFNDLDGKTVADLEDEVLYVAMLKKIDEIEVNIEPLVCGTKIVTTSTFAPHDQNPRPVVTTANDTYKIDDEKRWNLYDNNPYNGNGYPSAGEINVIGDSSYYAGVAIDPVYGYTFVKNGSKETVIKLNDEATLVENNRKIIESDRISFNAEVKAVHDWNTPTYDWSADDKTVTATHVCKNDPSHSETETVDTTSQVIKQATLDEEGTVTYTATFTNEAFETQTKEKSVKISVEPTNIELVVDEGYKSEVDGGLDEDSIKQDIVVTNTGSEEITFILGGFKDSSSYNNFGLIVGGMEATLYPKEGLSPGVYEAIVIIEDYYDRFAPIEIPVLFTVNEVIVYSNTQGNNQEWYKGSTSTADFTFKRSKDDSTTFNHFTSIKVDGKDVPSSNYTASSGSVIIKLKPSYLETLSLGEHTLTAYFNDGNSASAKFTVKQKKTDNRHIVPNTSSK